MRSEDIYSNQSLISNFIRATLQSNNANYQNACKALDLTTNKIDIIINNTDALANVTNQLNQTITIMDEEPIKKDFVFDRTDVRVIFISMYTLVFCCCFFGKFNGIIRSK